MTLIVEREDFEHAGFDCIVVGLDMGHRCGYVVIPEGHPWHGVEEGGSLDGVYVHGGVTWTGPLKLAEDAGTDDRWFVGFDCAHSGDAKDPALMSKEHHEIQARFGRSHPGDTIRTVEYAKAEVQSLAEQAAKVGVA